MHRNTTRCRRVPAKHCIMKPKHMAPASITFQPCCTVAVLRVVRSCRRKVITGIREECQLVGNLQVLRAPLDKRNDSLVNYSMPLHLATVLCTSAKLMPEARSAKLHLARMFRKMHAALPPHKLCEASRLADAPNLRHLERIQLAWLYLPTAHRQALPRALWQRAHCPEVPAGQRA
mmetsp:Transcript_37352/g.107654  ORF Transcript_37352/g.107654 Transcript_37352/m.107654 type:complete len:176 (+) Transcript_37352:58-585(+)